MTRDNDKRLAQALLHPASVALYGASDDVGKMGGRPVQFLKRTGFAGRIYPINPRRDEIQGLKAWPSLQSLPEVPDQVFVLTPTETVIPAVRECAALGVKVVTILASGFSESGAEGAAREGELRRIAKETGIRILGPSSLGVVNPRTGLVLTANAAFAEPDLPPGKVCVASHSGSMIGALVSRGKARGVGFAGLVSVGSEVDLNVGEICAATLDDPAIEGYLLFLESLRHGPELRAFARAAHARGKPVIAYKLGRSAAAAEMATTHLHGRRRGHGGGAARHPRRGRGAACGRHPEAAGAGRPALHAGPRARHDACGHQVRDHEGHAGHPAHRA